MAIGGAGLSSVDPEQLGGVNSRRLSIGIISAFRELFGRSNRLLNAMATASFGAYILHPAIVVTLQTAITDVTAIAFAKFVVVSVLGTAAAFAIALMAGHVPGIRAVLGVISDREASLVSRA